MEFIDSHPELKEQFEVLCTTRRNEILSQILRRDIEYQKLCRERADMSLEIKNIFINLDKDELFEKYSDMVYAQEVYELDIIYKQAFYDALTLLRNQGLLV